MINILSYQQPLEGRVVKEWVTYHTENETEYSKIATKMVRYMNVNDDKLYRIILRPQSSACGEYKRGNPDVISCEHMKEGFYDS